MQRNLISEDSFSQARGPNGSWRAKYRKSSETNPSVRMGKCTKTHQFVAVGTVNLRGAANDDPNNVFSHDQRTSH